MKLRAMNADVHRAQTEIEPCRLAVPEAALRRLRLRLGRGAATGEAWDASLAYAAPFDLVSELCDYFCHDFDLERLALFDLPTFTTRLDEDEWCFVHARSPETFAVPLLLLHGYSGSVAELAPLVRPLSNPRAHAGNAHDAFHVVCPALPGFGLSEGAVDARAIAEGCAELMQRLGYLRYVVHGSDLGAQLALKLAEIDSAHVAGLHVTALPAYPSEDASDMASLTSQEKSQLARLSELRQELAFQLPESPIQALAFALAQLEEAPKPPPNADWCDALLASLTLTWALGDPSACRNLYRDTRLAPAAATTVPLALHAFPLDAPSLRRFAERQHRVVEWTEHEHGGALPALERPAWLLDSLRNFFGRFR